MNELKTKVNLFIGAGRFDAAEKLVRTYLGSHGGLPSLHHLLGIVFQRQSRFAEALHEFKTVLNLDPTFVEAGLNLAATFCDLGQYEEASHVFDNLRKYSDLKLQIPTYLLAKVAQLHAECGKSYHELGMFAEAAQEYRKAATLHPKSVEVKLALAHLYCENSEFDRARKELEEVLQIDEFSVEARNLLGRLFYDKGNLQAAKDHWLKSQQMRPRDPISRAYLNLCQNS